MGPTPSPDLAVSDEVRQLRARIAELEHDRSETRFRELIENTSDWIWEVDANLRYIYASPRVWDLLGYTAEEVLGKTPFDLMPPEEVQHLRPEMERLLQDPRPFRRLENTNFHKDGSLRVLETSGVPVFDIAGRFRGFRGIDRDITERKRAEEELRASEERYRALAAEAEINRRELESLITSMHDGLVAVDAAGNPVMMNPAALQMHGYQNASEAMAPLAEVSTLFELRDADGNLLPPHRWPGSRALAGEPVTNLEVEVVRRDTGKHFVGYYNAVPVHDREGRIELIVITITDITEYKRMEQRLRDAQRMESIGLLAGGIAHDFNNLLVGVIGNASLAREYLPPANPASELLDSIIKAGEQAAHLTRQMLAYSGRGKFFLEVLNLSALIPDMSGLVIPSIPKKIALRLDLARDLPAIEADRGQIQQVFMNLVLNAAEAIGATEGAITVTTAAQEVSESYVRLHPSLASLLPGTYARLEVRDTGCGMEDATMAKIFEPFFSTKFMGRGLGLAAVAGIVRSHRGGIMVNSVPGEGSCFTVLFPVAERAAGQSGGGTCAAVLHGTGVLLVVDDEPIVRDMSKNLLEHYGYTVLVANSGLAAIDLFKRYPGEIALVILDLSMPHMSGQETLPELRKIRPDVKVVVSSGYTEAETMALFRGQPVAGFIQKPYTSAGIAEKVKQALG